MKPFVNITSPSGNIAFNVEADPIQNLSAFAIGYREAAQSLAAAFVSRAPADYDGYPVLYLYRHSLELFLKAVVLRGAAVMGLVGLKPPVVERLLSNHGLGRMLPAVKAIFRAMDWDFDATPIGTFAEFERIVLEVEAIDPGSYAFRYPMNTAGQAHLPSNFTVNVPNFAETMSVILAYLEGAFDILDDNLQSEAEARHEVQQLLAEPSEE